MLSGISDAELRSQCRSRIETLELWLRRLIDQKLTAAYGDYFNGKTVAGSSIIKRAIVEGAEKLIKANPSRYPRRVDALLLDDIATILCNPELYNAHFKVCFATHFPLGAEHVRWMLNRLVPIRNKLSHANPLGLSEAEVVFCFAGDLIEAIKTHYRVIGMENEYNVPLITKILDSFGNVFYRDQLSPVHDGGIMGVFSNDPAYYLRPGDILTLEVEVDASFESASYEIRWASTRKLSDVIDKPKLVLPIEDHHVAREFNVQCNITTHRTWHRMHNGADDFLIFYYRVLPPL